MTYIVLSLVLSQYVAATPAQEFGAANTIIAAWQDRANRTISANADRTRICVGPASGKTLNGRTTIRLGVIILSEQAQNLLNMPTPTGEAYGAAEIQIDPDQPTARYLVPVKTINDVLDIIREEAEVRASPLVATAEVCLVRRDAPEITASALYRCACAKSTSCKMADNVTAAPLGVTLSPGGFTPSAACQPKPCVARFDGIGIDKTWPSNCPK